MKPIGLTLVVIACLSSFLINLVSTDPQIQAPKKRSPQVPPADVLQEVVEGEEEKNKTIIVLTGNPQIDYIHDPNLPAELNGYDMSDYPFYSRVPAREVTNFTCDDRFDGFYAAPQHKCQVYHNCLFGIRYDFLCPNFTKFDQVNLICHYANAVDCEGSPQFFDRNIYADPPTTTTTTGAPQVKIIYVERPANRGGGGGRRGQRPRPPPVEEYYYDYEDEPAVEAKQVSPPKAQLNYEDDEFYYYDDEVVTTTTTTTRRPPPRRQRPSRPQRTRISGSRPRPPGGNQQTVVDEFDYDFIDEPPPSRRHQIRNPGVAELNNDNRQRTKKKKRRKITTTTTTVAPADDEYEYYYVYYDDEPTTTTTAAPLRRRIRKKKPQRPRSRPTAQERKLALRKAKNANSNFPSVRSDGPQPIRDREPIDSPVDPLSPPEQPLSPAEAFPEEATVVQSEVVPPSAAVDPIDESLLEESVFAGSDRVIVDDSSRTRTGSLRRPTRGGSQFRPESQT